MLTLWEKPMFCKFCGKQVDDDSLFCSNCGNSLIKSKKCETEVELSQNDESVNFSTSKEEVAIAKEKRSRKGELILLFIMIAMIIFAFSTCTHQDEFTENSSGCAILTREITSDDYTYTTQQSLTSYTIYLTPKVDFESCEVELILYNSSYEKIYADTITKKDLKKGSSYAYTFDFGVGNSLSGKEVMFYFSGKAYLL